MGQMVKQTSSEVTTEVSADPQEGLGAGMALQKCTILRPGNWTFISLSQAAVAGKLPLGGGGGNVFLGRAAPCGGGQFPLRGTSMSL